MNRALLKKSIDEWNDFYQLAKGSLIRRDRTIPLPNKHIGAALTGLRRCGKTYQALFSTINIPLESVMYYNFEDPIFLTHNKVKNLDLLLSVGEEFRKGTLEVLILDEIHNVNGWERWLRKIIDQKRYSVIVTGSSAQMLSKELATSLTGRCLDYSIWPLSFNEYLQFTGKNPQSQNDHLNVLRSLMKWGSLPEVVLTQSDEQKRRILKQYLNDILLKDVIQRNAIRNPNALMQLATYYLTNLSSLHSYSAVKRAFDINTETVGEYTRALRDAFLVFEVNRYHPNLKVQSRDPKKLYIIDTGFRTVGARSINEDTGKLLENLVFIELMRREKEVTYYKGKQEVDFVITEEYQPVNAIQVCASDLVNDNTRQRELNAIIECLKSLNLKKGKVLTLDCEEIVRQDGLEIEILPTYKWLQTSSPE